MLNLQFRSNFGVVLCTLVCLFTLPATSANEDLLTKAERSNYKATSTYEEVADFLTHLVRLHPHIHRTELGKSFEGRSLPLILLGDKKYTTPEEITQSGKMLVFLFGNIHAGEVCGKEALMMLARDLAKKKNHPWFDDLVIAIAPIYNADGNERFSKDNRHNQVGPEEGMGTRENAQGLDLNRDYVKLEAPETRALVRFLNTWDPKVIIDTHTTNGSFHRYPLTYAGPKHPASSARLIEYVRDKMFPEISRSLQKRKGIDTFFYGNFNKPHTHWSTYPDHPRYGAPYRGLRGRIGILSEAYAYDSFKNRVLTTLEFVKECLNYSSNQSSEIQKLLQQVDAELLKPPKEGESIALRTELSSAPDPIILKGFEEIEVEGKLQPTEKKKDYKVIHQDRFQPTLKVQRAHGYLIPANLTLIVEHLVRHGIKVEVLTEDALGLKEYYLIKNIKKADQAFQGHRLVRLETELHKVGSEVRVGSYYVSTSQRLGRLASYLLEPHAADGLVAWNFFDDHLKKDEVFPIERLVEEPFFETSPYSKPSNQPKKTLTFNSVYRSSNPPNLRGSPNKTQRWLNHGDEFLQTRRGVLLKMEARSFAEFNFINKEKIKSSLSKIPSLDQAAITKLTRKTSWNLDELSLNTFLFEHGNDLYFGTLDGSRQGRLTSTPEKEELFELSPNGNFAAFVRNNDLWVVDLETRTERQLTQGGEDRLRHGKNDWVYFEELYRRSWKAFWWSPDSRKLAFLKVDSRSVPEFHLVNDLPSPQGVEITPYPKPGDPNPTVKLGIVNVSGGDINWADLNRYDPRDFLISGVGWNLDGTTVYFYGQNRIQNWLDILTVEAKNDKVTRLLRETTQAWVSPPDKLHFLKDGSFFLTSERSGWKHLYHYTPSGKLIRAITKGEWEVRRVHGYDPGDNWIYFSGTKRSHIENHLYRVKLDGSKTELLTKDPGYHSIKLSPSTNFFIDTWSTTSTPEKVVLRNNKGELIKTLDSNPVPDLDRYVLCPVEHFQIPTRDGFKLEAQIIRPPNFSPNRKYPVWFSTYAGPHAQTVYNSWRGGRIWNQMLAQAGIIQFRCDPRSASGKGAVSAWTAYRQLGVQELEDIKDAIAWLKGLPYIDNKRIGMDGYSYGGYMTAYAMTHTKLFSAGISGAPVTDWHDYDSIYTERYMSTPADNPKGYQVTSARNAAQNLHGRLLLVHGLRDDNVHPQNSIRFIQNLQEANKSFDLMMYPSYRHSIRNRHFTKLRYDFIMETMNPDLDF